LRDDARRRAEPFDAIELGPGVRWQDVELAGGSRWNVVDEVAKNQRRRAATARRSASFDSA
jgi:hypothetical protein